MTHGFQGLLWPPGRAFAAILLTFQSLACLPSTTNVIFNSALTNETDWVYSEKVKLYSASDGGNIYFNAADSYIISPIFPSFISDVHLECEYRATSRLRPITLVPIVNGEDATNLSSIIADGTGEIVHDIHWDVDDDVQGFRIISGKDAKLGTFSLKSADITFYAADMIRAPTNLRIEATYRDAFIISWSNHTSAVATTLRITRRTGSEATYSTLAEWDFAWATNKTGTTRSIVDDLPTLTPPLLSGENVNIYQKTEGFIQIGSRLALGELRVHPLPEGAETMLLRASRHATDGYGTTMPVEWALDSVTNSITNLTLSTEMETFLVPVAGIDQTATLIIHSTTNHVNAKEKKASVNLESLKLVKDYIPANQCEEEFMEHTVRKAESLFLRVGGPGIYTIRAFSTAADGSTSTESAPLTISLTPTDPPTPCGLTIILR